MEDSDEIITIERTMVAFEAIINYSYSVYSEFLSGKYKDQIIEDETIKVSIDNFFFPQYNQFLETIGLTEDDFNNDPTIKQLCKKNRNSEYVELKNFLNFVCVYDYSNMLFQDSSYEIDLYKDIYLKFIKNR